MDITITETITSAAVTGTAIDVTLTENTQTVTLSKTGIPGSSGVVDVTSPITNTGTLSSAVLGIDSKNYIDIRSYGAVGDGTTDDTTAIQAALNACPAGGIVLIPAATFAITSPLTIPPTVTLQGTHGNRIFYDYAPTSTPQPSMLKAKSTFTGDALIRLKDAAEAGYANESTGQRIINLTIDGSALSSGTIRGIYATGRIREVMIDRVCIQFVPNNGIAAGTYSGRYPYSWWVTNTIVNSADNFGFSINGMTDSTFINCQSLNAGIHGWYITNSPNSQFTNCRSEWSGQHGYYITGGWGTTPAGSGGAIFTGCTTDRNNYNGFYVDSTGNGALIFNGLICRRDGRNGKTGGGSYAGFKASSATSPILITAISTYPGQDDDATGTISPQYGVSFNNNSYVAVSGASFIHGMTTGWYDGGNNTVLRRGPNIAERTGSPSSPTNIYTNDWSLDNSSRMIGTATYATTAGSATNAGTAVYSSTSGTAVFASSSSTSGTATYATTAGGAPPTGIAGGDLTGTYPNPTIAAGVIVAADLNSTLYGVVGSIQALGTVSAGTATTLARADHVHPTTGLALLASANAFTVGGHTIANAASGVIPLSITANATQSVNLFQILASDNSTVRAAFSSAGALTVSPSSGTAATINAVASASSAIGLVVKANTGGGGGNAVEVFDSSGTSRGFAVGPVGRVQIRNNGTDYGGALSINTAADNAAGIIIRANSATQTANLQEWQNSGGTVLGGRNALAQVWSGSTAPVTVATGGATSGTSSGTTATLTTASAHGLAVGDLVTIAGMTPSGYNGTYLVATVPSTTTYTVTTSGSNLGASTVSGTSSVPAQASFTARSAGTVGLVVKAAASPTANSQTWVDSTNAILARVDSLGIVYGAQLRTSSSLGLLSETQSGAVLTLARLTAAATNPGANTARLYFRDGTNANTLKLVVRAGAAGAETTILDNIPT